MKLGVIFLLASFLSAVLHRTNMDVVFQLNGTFTEYKGDVSAERLSASGT